MSTKQRKELVVFGYIRAFCKELMLDLPPKDLIELFISWITFMDKFDRAKSHENIQFIKDTLVRHSLSTYATVVGTDIIKKGDKQSWKFKLSRRMGLIGIVDNGIVESSKNIRHFTGWYHGGYGLTMSSFEKYHASANYSDGHFDHVDQLINMDCNENKAIIVTMELDLTQNENEKGILRYTFPEESTADGEDLKTNGKYSNIAYDDIDISKGYRAAVATFTTEPPATTVELLPG